MSPTSFGPERQIEAGVLNTGCVEAGPAVMLLHGWPFARAVIDADHL